MTATARRKWSTIALTIVAIAPVLLVAAFVASSRYADWSAERDAKEFCDEIRVGSDISQAIAKAGAKKIYWSNIRAYNFWFRGSAMSGAICVVDADSDGIVKAKMTDTYSDH